MSSFDEYVEAHNAAVRSGDWDAFSRWFADDAEVRFEGVPVGPFRGREEIRAAYESRPPDDEVEVRNVEASATERSPTTAGRQTRASAPASSASPGTAI